MTQSIDFEDLDSALRRADADAGAAAAHGTLCGMLCAQGRVQQRQWLDELLGPASARGDLAVREAVDLLDGVYGTTREQLHDSELGFALLLPHDDGPLAERVEALGEWCGGFLLGFGLGAREDGPMSPDVEELLADFIEVTRVRAEDDAGDEDGEVSYMQVVEYVRVGVLLIYEELHPVHGAPGLQ